MKPRIKVYKRKPMGKEERLIKKVFNDQLCSLLDSNMYSYLFEHSDLASILYKEYTQAKSTLMFFEFMNLEYEQSFEKEEDLERIGVYLEDKDDIIKRFIAQGGLTDNLEKEKEIHFSRGQIYVRKRDVLEKLILTPTYIVLEKIEEESIYLREHQYEAKNIAKSIIYNIESLDDALQESIISALIIDETKNTFPDLGNESMNMLIRNDWKIYKRKFNNLLFEYRQTLQNTYKRVGNPPTMLNEMKQKEIYDYFICDDLTKQALKLFIAEEIKSYTGTDIVVLVSALLEEKLMHITGTNKKFWETIRLEYNVKYADSGLNEHLRKIDDEKVLEEEKNIKNLYYKPKIDAMRKQIRLVISKVK